MAGLSGFGGLVQNPAEIAGGSLSNMPEAAAQARQVGIQTLQPFAQAIAANPKLAQDPNFMNRVRRIGKVYGIPVDAILGGQGGGAAAPTTPGGTPAPAPGGTPAPGGPGGTPQAGQAGGQKPPVNPQGGAASGITQQQLVAMAPFIKMVKQNPKVLQSPQFLRAADAKGKAVGLTPDHLKQILQKVMQGGGQPGGQPGAQQVPNGAAQPMKNVTPASTMQAPNGAPAGTGQPQQPQRPQLPPAGGTTTQQANAQNPNALLAYLGVKPTGLQPYGNVDLDKDKMDIISQANPGAARAAAYANAGIDPKTVPDYVLNAPRYIPPDVQVKAFNDTWMRISQMVKTGASVDTINGLIRSAGAADPELAAQLSSDPTIVEGLKQSSQLELQQLVDSGALKKAQADKAEADVAVAQSITDLDTAHAGLFKTQASVLPMEAQAKVTAAQAAATRASAYVADVSNRINNSQNGTVYQQYQMRMGTIKEMRQTYTQASTAYKTLLQTTLSSGVNPMKVKLTDPNTGKVTTLNDELIQAKQARDDAASWLQESGDPMLTRGVVQSAINAHGASAGLSTGTHGKAPFEVPKGFTAGQDDHGWYLEKGGVKKYWQGQ